MKESSLLIVVLMSLSVVEPVKSSNKNVVCFYANWAQYRDGPGKYLPKDIDVNLCSHITYAHLMVDLKTHKLVQRQGNDHELLAEIVGLKKYKPSLKVVISVGGWKHEEERRFSNMVQSNVTRAVFIESAISYMMELNLDGLSIDWEYPTFRGTSGPEDKHRFTLLLKEIREAYKRQNLPFTLSASVSSGPDKIKNAYEMKKIVKYLDWVNLMAYSLHGVWKKKTGHPTGMKNQQETVSRSLTALLKSGMPRNKINLGLATYGRSFTLLSKKHNGLSAMIKGGGHEGPYTGRKGILSYYEICSTNWDKIIKWSKSKVGKPYAYRGDQWVGYDSPDSLKHEVETIFNANCLHGLAFWTLGYDDFTGRFCGQDKYPLISAAVDAMDNEHCDLIPLS